MDESKIALSMAESFWGERAGVSIDFEAPEGQKYKIGLQSDDGKAFGVMGLGATWKEAMDAAHKSSMGQKFYKEIYLGD